MNILGSGLAISTLADILERKSCLCQLCYVTRPDPLYIFTCGGHLSNPTGPVYRECFYGKPFLGALRENTN